MAGILLLLLFFLKSVSLNEHKYIDIQINSS